MTGTFDSYRRRVGELKIPVAPQRLEDEARAVLGNEIYSFFAASAGAGRSAAANREAFDRWRIIPRMLRNIDQRDLGVSLFGEKLPTPVLLAPIGVQSYLHANGELATARAAAACKVPMILSASSSFDLEAVAAANGEGVRWFQFYWSNDNQHSASVLRRARDAGYSVLVVTLDSPMVGWRPLALDAGISPFAQGLGMAIYLSDPVFRSRLSREPADDLPAAVAHWERIFDGRNPRWDEIPFLRKHWDGPIMVKGIQHPDDARQALNYADGIVVSNHGGRQVDGAIGSLDALPKIADAVGGRIPLLFDSGVRTGADVLKVLALGADAVLVGRPFAWGLALGGDAGVEHVIRALLADIDITLGLAGYRAIADLGRDLLWQEV